MIDFILLHLFCRKTFSLLFLLVEKNFGWWLERCQMHLSSECNEVPEMRRWVKEKVTVFFACDLYFNPGKGPPCC